MSIYAKVMKELHPRVVIQQTQVPLDTARNNFPLKSTIMKSHPEFEQTLGRFVMHLMQGILGTSLPLNHCLHMGRQFLDNSIGYENAQYLALSGVDGGMSQVLDAVTDSYKKQIRQGYFTDVLNKHVDPLSFPQTVELMREIKQRMLNYAPESYEYVSAESMASKYRYHIEQYVNDLTRHKNLWKYI